MKTRKSCSNDQLQEVWKQLHSYCSSRNWRGYDPYDGLSSSIFRSSPFMKSMRLRQAWTQFHKRSPINFRGLCGIAPTLNAKGTALFAIGSGDRSLLNLLDEMRNPNGGWGYPFAWQSRAFYASEGLPNLICTAFAANAYRHFGKDCDVSYIKKELFRERGREKWITYVSISDTQVHNINMIGAALLGDRDCMEFSVKKQLSDGSWWYGEAANQKWNDNFHTGFCLIALKDYEQLTGDTEFDTNAKKGFRFWDKTFWREDGAPRYYHNRTYPLDVHCCAQGIVTYLAFGELEKANLVASWALKNMWDTEGFFWYQRGRFIVNRVCYMRWSQSWMYYALSKLIRANKK